MGEGGRGWVELLVEKEGWAPESRKKTLHSEAGVKGPKGGLVFRDLF